MSKREISAFGDDKESHSAGAVTSGKGLKLGKQHDATPSKNDERPSRQHRSVRAFGYLPRAVMGGLQKDSDRGSKESRQFANTGEGMPEGGNSAGRTLKPVSPYFAADFQGRSGQPDNQSINRGKGRT